MAGVRNRADGAGLTAWAAARGRSPRTALAIRLAALVAVALAAAPGRAGADDVRTFAATVDGRAGGTYTITTAAKDGVETTTVAAEVKVNVALRTHVYELNSVEVWKDGRLASVDAKSNDDGKKRTVSAVAGERGLTVTVNGAARQAAGDVLTATGVRVPAGDAARDAVLFDAEDGSEMPSGWNRWARAKSPSTGRWSKERGSS